MNSSPALDAWIAAEARVATAWMLRAISATDLLMERPGFGQRVTPRPGSVLASPVPAHYDPDPDYFFHWFRDSALVIDALCVALLAGYAERSTERRFHEFVEFTRSLQSLDGREFLRSSHFRAKVQPAFLQYVRTDPEIAALSGDAVLADVRVNADGTLDFIRWSRPQNDGPALRAMALLRWWREFRQLRLDPALMPAWGDVIRTDLAFALTHVREPCGDVWEEESGYHYYTQLVQAEALTRGGAWLEENGWHAVQGMQLAAEETLARLDVLWNEDDGFYRSRTGAASAQVGKDPNIAVILAVLHAGRAGSRHGVLDPRTQATLTALEEHFETQYAINRERPPGRGPALGRYPSDDYYGGGAWFLATLAAAEFYFRLAYSLRRGAQLAVVPANSRFRQRLGVAEGSPPSEEWARRALERGDAIMRTVQAFTPETGELSEQVDRTTGAQTSAKHLSWSYAAFITAAASRAEVLRPSRGGDRAALPEGTA